MKKSNVFILCLVLFLSACATKIKSIPNNELTNQSIDEIKHDITEKHPVNYIVLAAKLFNDGKLDDAVKWYYVGQIRFRAHLMANPDIEPSGEPALYSSLQNIVGTPINEYAGQDPNHWVVLVEKAIKWNAENPDGFTPKSSNKKIHAEVEANFIEFRDYVSSNKEKIRKQRTENGLKNS
ncbi:hypothetical protein [Aeromonas sp. 5HA1]|uniref:hypothetical protein n=1 Tax=Aeromonas sp. 5HA1 TaxID=2699197 RepID=UPI0023DDBFB5|nr:hypothetical protein [Aeromonas sp. 5HA1]MDF2404151.1 hypothetical protein [Aeromonas sp. 5HA1]